MAAEGLKKEPGEGKASEGADLRADRKVKGLLRWTGQTGPVTRRPAGCWISFLLPFIPSAPFLYPLITRPVPASSPALCLRSELRQVDPCLACRVSELGVRRGGDGVIATDRSTGPDGIWRLLSISSRSATSFFSSLACGHK